MGDHSCWMDKMQINKAIDLGGRCHSFIIIESKIGRSGVKSGS